MIRIRICEHIPDKVEDIYCVSKKWWPILYSNLLNKKWVTNSWTHSICMQCIQIFLIPTTRRGLIMDSDQTWVIFESQKPRYRYFLTDQCKIMSFYPYFYHIGPYFGSPKRSKTKTWVVLYRSMSKMYSYPYFNPEIICTMPGRQYRCIF